MTAPDKYSSKFGIFDIQRAKWDSKINSNATIELTTTGIPVFRNLKTVGNLSPEKTNLLVLFRSCEDGEIITPANNC